MNKSQDASVEQSTFGIQTGVLGVWAQRETKLSNQIALRSEIRMDAGFWATTLPKTDSYYITPSIR